MNGDSRFLKIYKALFRAFGPQDWWPGDTAFEVAVGAILTQNTNWSNVEKAITRIKGKGMLNARSIHRASLHELAFLVRPSGYYNIKAKRLKEFVGFLTEKYNGSMERMAEQELTVLREELLSVHGIGPETADSILLYALGKPVFVIDAYTKRVLSRHGITSQEASYGFVQQLFHSSLGRDARLYNEYHALFVRVGKEFCRPNPLCAPCPLRVPGEKGFKV